MKVRALAAHTPEAVRAALAARGWESDPARFAAAGLESLVVLLDGVTDDEREALAAWAARAGTDVLTGPGWGLVSGAASRVAPLARFDRVPPALTRLVEPLGRCLIAHADPPSRWAMAGGEVSLGGPVIIGVLNVTPDSFSDGGRLATVADAVRHAERLRADGAHLIDVGGESTRPGSGEVPAAAEVERVVPVIAALHAAGLGPVSVDTRKAAVARAAVDAGAAVVNDVSALAHDPAMADVVRETGAGVILMHMRGTPDTMDERATYGHVAADVADELRGAADRAAAAGIESPHIVLDPGLGFAKTAAQNLRLLDELRSIVGLGYPVAVGPSRKRFLGTATGRPVDDRDRATAVACALAWERGARLFRVHDVATTREALALAAAVTTP